MTLQEAYNFLESLKTETTNKSEIRVYEKFLHILSELKTREFTKDEIESIETELKKLNIKPDRANKKPHFIKLLKEFSEFLKGKFSLVTPKYYTKIGLSMGTAFGVVAGVLIGERLEKSLGIALGISLGMLIGLIIGSTMDVHAKTTGKML